MSMRTEISDSKLKQLQRRVQEGRERRARMHWLLEMENEKMRRQKGLSIWSSSDKSQTST